MDFNTQNIVSRQEPFTAKQATITEVEHRESKTSGNPMIVVKFSTGLNVYLPLTEKSSKSTLRKAVNIANSTNTRKMLDDNSPKVQTNEQFAALLKKLFIGKTLVVVSKGSEYMNSSGTISISGDFYTTAATMEEANAILESMDKSILNKTRSKGEEMGFESDPEFTDADNLLSDFDQDFDLD